VDRIVRVERLDTGWSVAGLAPMSGAVTLGDLPDMPEPLRTHLAVLLTAPVKFYDEVLGRRVSEDIFWVNTGADDG